MRKTGSVPYFSVDLVVQVAEPDERENPHEGALVIAVKDDIVGLLVQIRRPVGDRAILEGDVLELEELGDVDHEGQGPHQDDVKGWTRFVMHWVTNGMISENNFRKKMLVCTDKGVYAEIYRALENVFRVCFLYRRNIFLSTITGKIYRLICMKCL